MTTTYPCTLCGQSIPPGQSIQTSKEEFIHLTCHDRAALLKKENLQRFEKNTQSKAATEANKRRWGYRPSGAIVEQRSKGKTL